MLAFFAKLTGHSVLLVLLVQQLIFIGKLLSRKLVRLVWPSHNGSDDGQNLP